MDCKFKAGDIVCYKSHPDIYIGYVSPDINYDNACLIFGGKECRQIPIFTSDNWAKYFGHGICPNTLHIDEDQLMLFTGDTNMKTPEIYSNIEYVTVM